MVVVLAVYDYEYRSPERGTFKKLVFLLWWVLQAWVTVMPQHDLGSCKHAVLYNGPVAAQQIQMQAYCVV